MSGELLSHPKIKAAINSHLTAEYEKRRGQHDASFSQMHKTYETGCALLGPSVNVEWHDKIVSFALNGEEVEVEEFRNSTLDAVVRLQSLLAECRPYVQSQADAVHMLDGFGPRTQGPIDGLLERIDAMLPDENDLTTPATAE